MRGAAAGIGAASRTRAAPVGPPVRPGPFEGEHALSLQAQEERGRRWADEQGYQVRKVWKENLSAYSDVERPKYDAAMKAVLDGEVPALWCYALDSP